MSDNVKKSTALDFDNMDRYDLTKQENWEAPYPVGGFNNAVKDVMDIPQTDDMAGVFARAVFKNDRQRMAAVKLYYRHKKFKDDEHQELLRITAASTIGMNGRGRLESLFAAVQMLAPDMFRIVSGLPKHKDGKNEQVLKGSDFRNKDEIKPPKGGLGTNNQ